jgi:hypothetical protein
MEHTAIPGPPGFSNLSKVEQVRYLQALWNRIAENPSEVPVPDAHSKLPSNALRSTDAIRTRCGRPATSLTAWARKLGDRVPIGFNSLLAEPLLAEKISGDSGMTLDPRLSV